MHFIMVLFFGGGEGGGRGWVLIRGWELKSTFSGWGGGWGWALIRGWALNRINTVVELYSRKHKLFF